MDATIQYVYLYITYYIVYSLSFYTNKSIKIFTYNGPYMGQQAEILVNQAWGIFVGGWTKTDMRFIVKNTIF